MARQTVTYTFPGSNGMVTLRELTVEDQIQLQEQHAKNFSRMIDEMVKRCVQDVRGTPVDSKNRDAVWASLASKERDLIRKGYARLHNATEDESDSFLGSAVNTVEA